jgi:DNA-binding MarR family transcriptional regulator
MSTLLLTQEGEQKVLAMEGKGPDYAVLAMLYEMGGSPVDFDEIVNKLRTDEVRASIIVRRLINQGYVEEGGGPE